MVVHVDGMIRELDAMCRRNGHIGLVRRYLMGDHDIPYMPDDADGEFTALARQSITNYLPLIAGTFGKLLYVDGFRHGRSAENVEGWEKWRENKLESRQVIPMRGAIDYGVSYVAVDGDRIRTLPPRKSHAVYASAEDDYPIAGITEVGMDITSGGEIRRLYEFWQGDTVTLYARTTGRKLGTPDDPGNPYDGLDNELGRLERVRKPRTHGRPFVSWVRFRDRLDDEAQGLVRPLIGLQNRVNASVFYLLMALHYASFRQRWATGIMIPRDMQKTLADGSPNPNFGKPIEPFKAAVNRLWISESADSRFGDFDQTDVSGHLAAIEAAISNLLSIGQVSPLLAGGNSISNIAIESVAALNASMNSQKEALMSSFAGSWEMVFELAGIGDGRASVRWRDTEPRSFGQVVDGLLKLNQMGVPAEGLYEMVPGVTDQQLEHWRTLAERPTELDRLGDALRRQAAPTVSDPVPEAE